MKVKLKKIKQFVTLIIIFLMSINSFAASAGDNDGSAFITKAEYDSLKNNFQSQIDSYNQSIDSKIDNAIASYLSGISIAKKIPTIIDNAPAFISSWSLPALNGSTYISYAHFITAIKGIWDATDTQPYDFKLCHNSVAGDQASGLRYCSAGTAGNVLWVSEVFDTQDAFNTAVSGGLTPLSVWKNSFKSTYYGALQNRENQTKFDRCLGATITPLSNTDAVNIGLTEFGSKVFNYSWKMKSNQDQVFKSIYSNRTTVSFSVTIPAGTEVAASTKVCAIFENSPVKQDAPCINYLSGKKLPTGNIKVVSSTYTNKIDTANKLVTWHTNTTGYNTPVAANDNYYGYGQLNFTTTIDKLKNEVVSSLAGKTCYYYSGAPLFVAPETGEVTVKLTLKNRKTDGSAVSGNPTTLFAISKNFSNVDIGSDTSLETLKYGSSNVSTITAAKNSLVTFSFNVTKGDTYFIKALPSSDTVSFSAEVALTD